MILFKGKKKLPKLQYGGKIPFYTPFQVTHAAQPTVGDIGLMLQKHQAPAKPKSAKTGTGDKKFDPYKNVDGLTNDLAAYMEKAGRIEEDIERGIRSNPDFLNTKTGQEKQYELNSLYSYELANMKNIKAIHRQNVEKITANNYGSQWFMQGNSGLVKNRRTGDFEWVHPSKLHSKDKTGKQLYDAVNYADAAILRENSFADVINPSGQKTNFIMDNGFSTRLGQGMSMHDAFKKNVDVIFDKAEWDSQKKELTIGNVNIKGDEIKKYAEGSMSKTNKRQIDALFQNAYFRLEGTPAWDTMIAEAYRAGAKNEKEARERVHRVLLAQKAGELGIIIDESSTKIQDDPADAEGADGGTGKVKVSPASLDAIKGLGDKVVLAIDSDIETGYVSLSKVDKEELKDKDLTTTIVGDRDPDLKSLLEKDKPIIDNKELSERGIINEAFLADGTKLKDLQIKLDPGAGDSASTFDGLSAGMLSVKDDPLVTTIPIDNTGKIANPYEDPSIVELRKELDAFDIRIKNTIGPRKEELKRERSQLIEDVLSQLSTKYTMRTVYVLDAIYNTQEVTKNGQDYDLKGASAKTPDGPKEDEIASYMSEENFGQYIDTESYLNPMDWLSEEGDESKYWVRTKVLVPTRNALAIHRADEQAKVYTDLHYVEEGTVGSNRGTISTLTPENLNIALNYYQNKK